MLGETRDEVRLLEDRVGCLEQECDMLRSNAQFEHHRVSSLMHRARSSSEGRYHPYRMELGGRGGQRGERDLEDGEGIGGGFLFREEVHTPGATAVDTD